MDNHQHPAAQLPYISGTSVEVAPNNLIYGARLSQQAEELKKRKDGKIILVVLFCIQVPAFHLPAFSCDIVHSIEGKN